jgi:hypothetical protein
MTYWSVKELADHLRVPLTWVYDRTRKNGPERIPHHRFGKYVRFNPECAEFQTWLRSHEVNSSLESTRRYEYRSFTTELPLTDF